MSWFRWAVVVWLAAWVADCGQYAFHRCDDCRNAPDLSWSQWLSGFAQMLLLWPVDALVLLKFITTRRRGNRS